MFLLLFLFSPGPCAYPGIYQVTFSRQCKTVRFEQFFQYNFDGTRYSLICAIIFTPREYGNIPSVIFFPVYSLFPMILPRSPTVPAFFFACRSNITIIYEARNAKGFEGGRKRSGYKHRSSVEKGRSRRIIYSSPIEDGRSFKGSASVAYI